MSQPLNLLQNETETQVAADSSDNLSAAKNVEALKMYVSGVIGKILFVPIVGRMVQRKFREYDAKFKAAAPNSECLTLFFQTLTDQRLLESLLFTETSNVQYSISNLTVEIQQKVQKLMDSTIYAMLLKVMGEEMQHPSTLFLKMLNAHKIDQSQAGYVARLLWEEVVRSRI